MHTFTVVLTITSFIASVVLIMWRPRGLNVAIPAMCGAALTVISGSVTLADLSVIGSDVGGAAVTILSTIAMALALESFGIFQYVADFMAKISGNSGIKLFWYINLMSFLMTLLFNNDGGIILATPILIMLLRKLGLKPHQQIPYLISGALIDTASSAPLGVSNIVNLISLKIIGMNLLTYSKMMFIPSILGIGILAVLNYFVLRKHLVLDLAKNRTTKNKLKPIFPADFFPHHKYPMVHAVREPKPALHVLKINEPTRNQKLLMMNILLYVLAVRVALFVGAYFGVPVSVTAVIGAAILLIWRWIKLRTTPMDILQKTPWHVLFFAFGLYVVVYGVHKIGFTTWLIHELQPFVAGGNLLHAIAAMAISVTTMSNIFDNHPALMIGTLSLTSIHLTPMTLHVAYLGNIIGSDIGSLITPIGLLATLIWMHVLKQHHIHISWGQYMRVTAMVIPVTVVATIFLVYGWILLIH